MITITKKAKEYMQSVSNGGYITLTIKGGGCSGFQYVWGLSETKKTKLKWIETADVIDNILLLDPLTRKYIYGSTIDYVTELSGSFLTVANPTATAKCGCGESFSV